MTATTAPLRIGIIGIGGFGGAHLRAARDSERIDLCVGCDADQFVLDYEHVAHPEFDLTPDWHRLRDNDELDAVVVAVPHDRYPEIVPALLEAGRNVLMEKPFGRNLAEAGMLAEAATRSGRVLMVGGQNKYIPAFRRTREYLADDRLGDIFLVRGTNIYRWGGDRDWGWRGIRARSGGVAVLDAGWHMIEQLVAFHGVPEKVYAATGTMKGMPEKPYDVDDKAALVLHWADGSIGQLLSCFVTAPAEWRIVLHGTKGALEIERRHIRFEPVAGDPFVEQVDEGEPVRAQLDHFADVIQRGVPCIGGPEAAMRVMRVIDAAYRSIASGNAEPT